MIPMRTSSIFRSRWMALLWAAGIVWLALDVAGGGRSAASSSNAQSSSAPADGDSDAVNAAADALGL